MCNYFFKLLLSLFLFLFLALPTAKAAPTTAWRVPPLFWYERDPAEQQKFSMALLLYWNVESGKDKFRLLAPFYYDSMTLDERLRILLPIHFYYQKGSSLTKMWIPYFHKEDTKVSTDLIFPLLFKQQSEEYDTGVFFPFYWTYQSKVGKESSLDLFLPFYLGLQDKKSQSVFFPLGWTYSDANISQGLVLSYYWKHSEKKRTDIGFPIYWNFWRKSEKGIRDIQVAVPWVKVQSPNSSFRTFFPLYWGWTSQEGATKWDLLLPLFLNSKTADGRKKLMTPFYSHYQDSDGTTYGHLGPSFFMEERWGGKLYGLFPLAYYKKESDFYKFRFLTLYLQNDLKEEHRQISFFPLFQYRRNFDRTQWLTPLFLKDSDPDSSRGFFLSYLWKTEFLGAGLERRETVRNRILFPLWWSLTSDEEKSRLFLPLYAYHKEGMNQSSIFFPFYFSKISDEDRFTFLPFYMKRDSTQHHWTGTLFIFWQTQKEDKFTTLLIPFYRKATFPEGSSLLLPNFYYLKDKEGTQGFFLPYLWDKRGKTQYELFPPLYWQFKSPSWNIKTILPYYTWQTRHVKEVGLFPLWAKTKPTNESISPPDLNEIEEFFVNSQRFLPFYFYRKLQNGSDLWLPILLSRLEKEVTPKGEISVRRRLALVSYWEKSPQQTIHRLDPLFTYYNTPRKKGFGVPTIPFPIWRYEREQVEDKESIVSGSFFPYIWKREKTEKKDIVFPIFYKKRRFNEEGTSEIGRTTWFLNYYFKFDEKEAYKRKIIFPLYYRFMDSTRNTAILFPLWWHQEKEWESASLFFPVYFRKRGLERNMRLDVAPGFLFQKDPESSTLWVGNYFSRKIPSKEEEWQLLFPVYWHQKEKERSISYLFPLYLQQTSKNFKWKTTFPIFWRFETDRTKVTIVPPYFSVTKRISGQKISGVAILWTYSRNPKENWKNFQILGGLLGVEKKEDKRSFTFLYFLKI